jgi:hypothetical protein
VVHQVGWGGEVPLGLRLGWVENIALVGFGIRSGC